METLQIISLILGILVTASLIFWIGLAYRLYEMSRDNPTIREGLSLSIDENNQEELVSIIVPAHNEERVIDRCCASLRTQTYQHLQIIFVLDRCTDQTKEILQKHVEEDPRVTYIENESCPDGWAGKCNAAKVGSQQAIGNWLLFTDADTKFDAELVRCSIASATKRGAALLSLLSSLTTTNGFEKIAQPVASTFLVRQYPVDKINREHNPKPFANGQFLLFQRDAYESIGGHDAVSEALLEDIAFARAIHVAGHRVQVLFADGMLRCSMYPTFEAFQNGWKRIFIESSNRNVTRLRKSAILACLLNIVMPATSIMGIIVGTQTSQLLFVTSIAAMIGYFFNLMWLYRMNHAPMMYAFFAPLGSLVVTKIFLDAANTLQNRIPIRWGGKEYILEPE